MDFPGTATVGAWPRMYFRYLDSGGEACNSIGVMALLATVQDFAAIFAFVSQIERFQGFPQTYVTDGLQPRIQLPPVRSDSSSSLQDRTLLWAMHLITSIPLRP